MLRWVGVRVDLVPTNIETKQTHLLSIIITIVPHG